MANTSDILDYKALKKQITRELYKKGVNKNTLKVGQYSAIHTYTIKNQTIAYRVYRNENGFRVVLKNYRNNAKSHPPIFNKNLLFIYDKELNRSVKVYLKDFIEISKNEIKSNLPIEETIDFDLSNEEKELLCTGQEIALRISSKQSSSNKAPIVKNYKKIFVADLSFFLGKTQLLTKECQQAKKLQHLIKLKREPNY